MERPNVIKARSFWRRGQTAVEYLLVTVSLTVAFAVAYRVLQWYLAQQFKQGGVVILRMYQEFPR